MKKMTIRLGTIENVKEFVDTASKIEGDVTLLSGRYVVDGKSIMGVFSLDLTQPLTMEIEHWKDEYAAVFKKYLLR